MDMFLARLAWGAVAAASAISANFAVAADDFAECGVVHDSQQLNDYRLRDSSAQLQWSVADIKRNHYDPAVARMRAGEYSHTVIADLNFLLRGWPNHYPALEALIRYDLAGGQMYEFPTIACYFQRARRFAPDDVNVLLHEGFYFWKKGNAARAVESYEEALAIDPSSADTHYNLGLVYLELAEFEKASRHARAAYAAGYPLPGLRNRLKKAGHWHDLANTAPR